MKEYTEKEMDNAKNRFLDLLSTGEKPNSEEQLLDVVSEKGYDFRHIYGCDDAHEGGFYIQLPEGILYIPYDEIINGAGYEQLLVNEASWVDLEIAMWVKEQTEWYAEYTLQFIGKAFPTLGLKKSSV